MKAKEIMYIIVLPEKNRTKEPGFITIVAREASEQSKQMEPIMKNTIQLRMFLLSGKTFLTQLSGVLVKVN